MSFITDPINQAQEVIFSQKLAKTRYPMLLLTTIQSKTLPY